MSIPRRVNVDPEGRVTIPLDIRRKLDIDEGDDSVYISVFKIREMSASESECSGEGRN